MKKILYAFCVALFLFAMSAVVSAQSGVAQAVHDINDDDRLSTNDKIRLTNALLAPLPIVKTTKRGVIDARPVVGDSDLPAVFRQAAELAKFNVSDLVLVYHFDGIKMQTSKKARSSTSFPILVRDTQFAVVMNCDANTDPGKQCQELMARSASDSGVAYVFAGDIVYQKTLHQTGSETTARTAQQEFLGAYAGDSALVRKNLKLVAQLAKN